MRHSHLLLIATLSKSVDRSVETAKRCIYYFQGLLRYFCIQQLVVLIFLIVVIVGLVAKMLALLKIILPERVKIYVLEVFTQPTQLPQILKILLFEPSNLIFLSQLQNVSAKNTTILAKRFLFVHLGRWRSLALCIPPTLKRQVS